MLCFIGKGVPHPRGHTYFFQFFPPQMQRRVCCCQKAGYTQRTKQDTIKYTRVCACGKQKGRQTPDRLQHNFQILEGWVSLALFFTRIVYNFCNECVISSLQFYEIHILNEAT